MLVAPLVLASPASAGCGLLGLSACPPPPSGASATAQIRAPDPGGNEYANLAVPPPAGKLWGFTPSFTLTHVIDAPREVGYLQAVGAQALRYTVSWKGLQRTPSAPPLPDEGGKAVGTLSNEGSYLDDLDEIYLALTGKGLTPVISLLGSPTWATDYASCSAKDSYCKSIAASNANALPPSDARMNDWRRFAGALAARYPKAVYEPWNEPNIKPFWNPSDKMPDPARMERMQCSARAGIKERSPTTTVLSAGFAGSPYQRPDGSPTFESYLDRTYGLGLRDCMDGLAWHFYPANQMNLGANSVTAAQFDVVRRVRAKYGDTRQMWITETGSSTFPKGATEAQQASINTRLYDKLLTMGDVKAVMFHTMRNPVEAWRGRESEEGYHYGFLRGDWSPKPVWCAFVSRARKTYAGC